MERDEMLIGWVIYKAKSAVRLSNRRDCGTDVTMNDITEDVMSVVINSNYAATVASDNLATSNALLQKSLNRLSSGSKIVNPADDAGGLAVSMKLSAAAVRQGATKNNLENANSFLQTQDGVLKIAGKILSRISELKVLYGNVTKSSSDKANYDTEYQALKTQLTAIGSEKFNSISLFGGSTMSVGLNEQGTAGFQMSIGGVDLPGLPTTNDSWIANNTGINKPNFALKFLDGQFVSGWGDSTTGGTIATSSDGGNWTQRLQVPGAGIYSFAAGNGKLVAGSNWGKVFSSSDNGATWTQGSYSSAAPLYVSFINGQFVGTAGTGFSSTDGVTWSSGPNVSGSNATNGSNFVAATTSISISNDGTTWTVPASPPPSGPWYKVAFGVGTYVAVSSSGGIYTSPDGNSWAVQTSPTPSTSMNGITFGGGKFIASGDGGVVLESLDGVNWIQQATGTSMNLGAVAYGNGKTVVTGTGGGQLVSTASTASTAANTDSLANISLSTITDAIGDVATYRAQNGAQQSRIGYATEMVTTNQANLEAANSRITDVDVANESTTLARMSILVQAGTAMLSQANQSSQMALKLLAA